MVVSGTHVVLRGAHRACAMHRSAYHYWPYNQCCGLIFAALHLRTPLFLGAADGNRTRTRALEGPCSAIKLPPHNAARIVTIIRAAYCILQSAFSGLSKSPLRPRASSSPPDVGRCGESGRHVLGVRGFLPHKRGICLASVAAAVTGIPCITCLLSRYLAHPCIRSRGDPIAVVWSRERDLNP